MILDTPRYVVDIPDNCFRLTEGERPFKKWYTEPQLMGRIVTTKPYRQMREFERFDEGQNPIVCVGIDGVGKGDPGGNCNTCPFSEWQVHPITGRSIPPRCVERRWFFYDPKLAVDAQIMHVLDITEHMTKGFDKFLEQHAAPVDTFTSITPGRNIMDGVFQVDFKLLSLDPMPWPLYMDLIQQAAHYVSEYPEAILNQGLTK